MKFTVDNRVFESLPEVCFGAVVIKGISNKGSNPDVSKLLSEAVELTREKFKTIKPKEHPDVLPYRDAFKILGFNPNKFPCSVEALSARIAKGGSIPDINPVVNLVNAFSLKYTLPMGAHDLDSSDASIEVRFSREGDLFIPFGETHPEKPDPDELVYARGSSIKTRKWIWRQSDQGKVTGDSKNIFIPIDGFSNHNLEKVKAAGNQIVAAIEKTYQVKPTFFLLDKTNRSVEL